jgi:hypothetical protein
MPDAAILGLLDPRLPATEIDAYTSWTALRPLMNRLNPEAFSLLTDDKGIFYRYCEELAVPVPKLYAVFLGRGPGWAWNGSFPSSRADWLAFIGSRLPDEFVVKPARGWRGLEINAFRRESDDLTDSFGRRTSVSALYESMLDHPRFHSWVIQEQLRSHPELVRLSGTEALQCARLITLIDAAGTSRIIWAHFRTIGGDALFDNFRGGESGNLRVRISRATGALISAVGAGAHEFGRVELDAHPRTGVRFADVTLPFWQEATELVLSTAPRFLPLRTLGWDVGFTAAGPVIIEANVAWAPPNELGGMPDVLASLEAALEEAAVTSSLEMAPPERIPRTNEELTRPWHAGS